MGDSNNCNNNDKDKNEEERSDDTIIVENEEEEDEDEEEEDEEEEEEEEDEEEEWGTLEELLLASAVNRHGTDSWDTVASLLRGPHVFSPENCRRKYLHLLRRFSHHPDSLLHHLRHLRVLHLQHHLHLHDLHILSLEEKVKTLERGDAHDNDNTITTTTNNNSNNNIVVRDVDEPPDPRDLKRDSAEDRSVNESNSSKDPLVKGPLRELVSESKPDDNINTGDLEKQQQQSSDVQSSASLTRKKRRRTRVGIGINSSGDELEGELSVSPANKGINIKSQPLIRFLDLVFSHKHAIAFHRRLPTQETEKYRNVVRQYMDLDMVQSRLDRGIYNECHLQFYRDLLLIFTNAVLFYRKSSAEHIAAREMRKVVMEEITLRTHKPKVLPANPDPEPVVKKPRSSSTMVVCRRRSSIQGLSENMVKKEESHSLTHNSSIKNNNNIANSKMGNGGEEVKPKGDEHEKKVDGGSSSNMNVLVSRKEKEGDKGDGVSNSSKFLSRERSSLGRGTLRLSDNNSKKIISKDGNKREKIENGNSSNKELKEESPNGEGDEREEKSKKNIDQKQDKVTTILKKQGVANFLKRIKQNLPSSQEEVINNHSDGDKDDDDRKDQPVQKEKMSGNGKKTGGSNARKNSSSKEVDTVGTRRSSGRKGEEGAASSRAIGRPPKRKAAIMGTPDSGKVGKSGAGIARKKPRK